MWAPPPAREVGQRLSALVQALWWWEVVAAARCARLVYVCAHTQMAHRSVGPPVRRAAPHPCTIVWSHHRPPPPPTTPSPPPPATAPHVVAPPTAAAPQHQARHHPRRQHHHHRRRHTRPPQQHRHRRRRAHSHRRIRRAVALLRPAWRGSLLRIHHLCAAVDWGDVHACARLCVCARGDGGTLYLAHARHHW